MAFLALRVQTYSAIHLSRSTPDSETGSDSESEAEKESRYTADPIQPHNIAHTPPSQSGDQSNNVNNHSIADGLDTENFRPSTLEQMD